MALTIVNIAAIGGDSGEIARRTTSDADAFTKLWIEFGSKRGDDPLCG
jgi:hypothetical protein